MDSLYIPQLVKVKINLEPSELDGDYETKLKSKIKEKYGDTCYNNGFIRKSSIEITKLENGRRTGSHFHGVFTFKVEFKALFCIPKKDKLIRCRIKTVNKFGALAVLYPMEIIIPKQIQQLENIDVFSNLKPNDYVYIRTLNYEIKNNKLIVVGIITELVIDKPNHMELPNDGLLIDQYQASLIKSDTPPDLNPILGDNKSLNELKVKITPYSTQVQPNGKKVLGVWDTLVKYLISPYELIDIYRPDKVEQKYAKSIIKYDESGQNGLYPVFSRAYFKLWEVIAELQILSKWKDQPIQIANVAEGPGGFINCLLDFRNQQHGSSWTQDHYSAITLKNTGQSTDHTLDWQHKHAQKYFNHMKHKGYNLNFSYGLGDGNLLNSDNIHHFVQVDLKNEKCELVTADGGMELDGDEEYSIQELINAKLFFAEILTALSVQKIDGTFILKLYDVYHTVTLHMINLLSVYYDHLSIIKPVTSRPANSEKYLVCQGFKGINENQLTELFAILAKWLSIESNMSYLQNTSYVTDLFNFIADAGSAFSQNLAEFNDYDLTMIIEKITEGLNLIVTGDVNNTQIIENYKINQKNLAIKWCQQYKLPYVDGSTSTSIPTTNVVTEPIKITLKKSIVPDIAGQQQLLADKQKELTRALERVGHLKKVLPVSTPIGIYLDVGAGSATISGQVALAYKPEIIHATDIYPEDKFIQPYPDQINIIYHQILNNQWPFLSDNSTDLITAYHLIHHLLTADYEPTIKEIYRVLKPGGYFFFREHDVGKDDHKLQNYLKDIHSGYNDFSPVTYWSRPELQKNLESYGFKYVGSSDYTAKNPQATYHSLFQKI